MIDSKFLRLLSSSVISNAITYLLLPIVARIFLPNEIGLFQSILAYASILSILVSLQFETAILLARYEKEKKDLFSLGIFVNIFNLFIVGVFFVFLKKMNLLNTISFFGILNILVLTFLIAQSNVLRSCLISFKKIKQYSHFIIYQNSSAQILKLVFGYFKPVSTSITFAQALSLLSQNLMIINLLKLKIYKIRRSKIKFLYRKYKNIIIKNSGIVIINVLSMQMPMILILSYFGPVQAGIFAMSIKIVDSPMNLITNSISKVYITDMKDKQDERKDVFNRYSLLLLSTGIIFFGLGLFLVNRYLTILLGDEWKECIQIINIISIWKVMQYITKPLSVTINLVNEENIAFIISLCVVCIKFVIFFIRRDFLDTLLLLSITSFAHYFVYYIIMRIKIYRSSDVYTF